MILLRVGCKVLEDGGCMEPLALPAISRSNYSKYPRDGRQGRCYELLLRSFLTLRLATRLQTRFRRHLLRLRESG
jgi:hypothetical protein